MNILLIGATGMIGSAIASEATARNHSVTGTNRSGGDGVTVVNASNASEVATHAEGQDAIVLAVSPPRDGSDPVAPLLAAGRGTLEAAKTANVDRVVIVGGAGSLLLPDNSRVVDGPDFPAEIKGEALAHADLLDAVKAEAGDLAWTYISPPAMIAPGERTGAYTTGEDHLLFDAEGQSAISVEDFALALVDEIENGAAIGRRITVAAG